MFHLRSVWEHNLNQPIDQQSIAIGNVMRTKNNAAQMVIGTMGGELLVIKFSSSYSHQDLLASVHTGQPILGIMLGSFSAPFVVRPGEPHERLEIAVVHPTQVQVYSPKRNATTNDVALQLLYTVTLESHHAASFTACHRRGVALDEHKNRRLSVSSTIAVKTINGMLLLIQGRRVVQKVTMSKRYALPAPIAYNPLADQLIVATFEYDVIGLRMEDLLSTTSPPGQEADQRLTPVFQVSLGGRVQQLLCGRFFMGDSGRNGEVAVVADDQILFFSDTGLLVREVKAEERVAHIAPVYWQGASGQPGKHPRVVSLLALLADQTVYIVQNGTIRWKGLSCNAGVSHIDFQTQHDENTPSWHVSAAEDSSQSEHTVPQQCSGVTQQQILQIKEALHGANLPRPEQRGIELRNLADDDEVDVAAHATQRRPLAATRTIQPVALPDIPYPLYVCTPQSLATELVGGATAPTINPRFPGLFVLATCGARISVHYFGTTVDQLGGLLPERLPDIEASRTLRDELTGRLAAIRAHDRDDAIDTDSAKLECAFAGVQASGGKIVTTGTVSFSQTQYDDISNLRLSVQALDDQLDISIPQTRPGTVNQPFSITVYRGQFVCSQRILCIATAVTFNNHDEPVRAQLQHFCRLPLLSYCVFDLVAAKQAQTLKYSVTLSLSAPVTSLAAYLRRHCGQLGENIATRIGQEESAQQILSIVQANGQMVTIGMNGNHSIELRGNGYEVFFMAVEFLRSGDGVFNIQTNNDEFADYFAKFYQSRKNIGNTEKEMEDELIKYTEKFTQLNNKLNEAYFSQQNPILDFQDEEGYCNIAEHLGVLELYIRQLIDRLQKFNTEKQNYDSRIQAMVMFAIQIKSGGDEDIVEQLMREYLECQIDSLDAVVRHRLQGSCGEQLVRCLIE